MNNSQEIGSHPPVLSMGGAGRVAHLTYEIGGVVQPPATTTLAIVPGENYLTITTTGGDRIISTDVTDALNFSDMRQVRLSGLAGYSGAGAFELCPAYGNSLGCNHAASQVAEGVSLIFASSNTHIGNYLIIYIEFFGGDPARGELYGFMSGTQGIALLLVIAGGLLCLRRVHSARPRT